ncbi:MAG: hypothetical protein NXI00_10855 [Cytophagales bacterium]|nr:hypothetical protein [Cytophagales bacterium]
MNRVNLILGNEITDLSHSGGDLTKVMNAEITLGAEKLADVYAYALNGAFEFTDIQELLPEFGYPLPSFTGYVQSNVDALKRLDINFTQDGGYSSFKSYYVLLEAGRSAYRRKGTAYGLRQPIPFLTNQPNFKKSTAFSMEWLFLPLNFGEEKPSQLNLKATAVNAAGELTTVVLHTVPTIANFTILGIDVSPYRVSPNLPSDTVGYYIQVFDESDDVVSESKYYHLIPDHEEDFTVVFRNSLGTWDTMTLQGNQARSISPSSGTIDTKAALKKYDSSYTRTVKIRASGLDVRWQIYLQELMLSKEVHLVENGYHQLIPIDEDMTYLESGQYTENMEFSFRFAANDKSY